MGFSLGVILIWTAALWSRRLGTLRCAIGVSSDVKHSLGSLEGHRLLGPSKQKQPRYVQPTALALCLGCCVPLLSAFPHLSSLTPLSRSQSRAHAVSEKVLLLLYIPVLLGTCRVKSFLSAHIRHAGVCGSRGEGGWSLGVQFLLAVCSQLSL